ncbi:hypothetical protein B7463_g12563, partial [Scytalidium lignicola]
MSNPLRMTPQATRIAGHRGYSSAAPENTLAAFRKAREIGGKGVTCETDLALTRDGELILIHDETVDRTTNGHGLVCNMDYSEIAKLDAGRWFDATFTGERIPLLRDALLLARELGIIYQLELKIYNRNNEIFPKLRALINELQCADLLQFSSFDFVQLRALKEAIPDVPTVALSHSRLINPAAVAREANVDAVNLEIQHFPSGEARQLHEEGFAVFLHVPSPERLGNLKSYGVDVEAQVVGWVREGLLDQVISDDVAQVTPTTLTKTSTVLDLGKLKKWTFDPGARILIKPLKSSFSPQFSRSGTVTIPKLLANPSAQWHPGFGPRGMGPPMRMSEVAYSLTLPMESPRLNESSRTSTSTHQKTPLTNRNYRGRVRTGCLVCRARKVKCDEQRPGCQKCAKSNKTCVYRTASRWGSHLTPVHSNLRPISCQQDQISAWLGPENVPPQTETGEYPIHEPPLFLGNSSDSGICETLIISNDLKQANEGLSVPADADESPSNGNRVDAFSQGGDLSITETTRDRFQQTSQLIYFSTTMDLLAAPEVPASSLFCYFMDVVDCPLLSPYDRINWIRIKAYIVQLALQQTSVAKCLLALQTLYRAQVDHLPMTHAMSVYQAAITSFESISGDDTISFDIILVVAFLLCLCVATLPNEDDSNFGVLDGAFATRLEAWLLSGYQSSISLRIGAWLQLLNITTKRPGSPGILSKPLFKLVNDHIKEIPNLSELDRDTHPENSLYDTVATQVFTFYLRLQKMSDRVVEVTHYRRSRTTPADQAEVTDLMSALKTDLASLWEDRPAPLRLQPDKLREHFSTKISTPLIALAGVCIAAYHTEIIVIGRILGDPPFPTTEAKHALQQIRNIIDGDWNVSAEGTLNPGYVRPLFMYALESFQKDEIQWAADRLRQIKNPISRSNFLASFVEAHGEAQRAQGRRVTMKYFCYMTFGVPLPYM